MTWIVAYAYRGGGCAIYFHVCFFGRFSNGASLGERELGLLGFFFVTRYEID